MELKPDFFIVGAPKAGTTSMDYYLSQHPEVFIPYRKDIHFFGSDLTKKDNEFFVLQKNKYLELFSHSHNYKTRGETSVMYLYSVSAPFEIKEFSPHAKIIIMLRNPIEMMYAQHSHLFWVGYENIESFEKALEAETRRKQGRDIPKYAFLKEALFYKELALYSEQVKRYNEVFGKNNVHIILFDDYKRDTAVAYRDTLSFLDVQESFSPHFNIINRSKKVRIQKVMPFLQEPPYIAKIILSLFSDRKRLQFIQLLMRINTKYEKRKAMNEELKKKLCRELSSEVKKLSDIINRDVTHWTQF